jgi:hypothetical protein
MSPTFGRPAEPALCDADVSVSACRTIAARPAAPRPLMSVPAQAQPRVPAEAATATPPVHEEVGVQAIPSHDRDGQGAARGAVRLRRT